MTGLSTSAWERLPFIRIHIQQRGCLVFFALLVRSAADWPISPPRHFPALMQVNTDPLALCEPDTAPKSIAAQRRALAPFRNT
jgi:hypothetical protein|tara:strand:- start:193 stop:441 length:249 start_codon:yes stop_codon:yes gene_type:complete